LFCIFSLAFQFHTDERTTLSRRYHHVGSVFFRNIQFFDVVRYRNCVVRIGKAYNGIFEHVASNQSIYFQINKENQTARTTLLKFSELLRYQLYECNTERISIEKEVAYLENYIDLQRLRYGENYKIDFKREPSVASSLAMTTSSFEIPPLLVVPFVENAFKYVSNHVDKLNEIEIKLDRDGAFFTCYVRNTTEPMREKTSNESGGIGLQNVRRRLDLLYQPNDFELKIEDNATDFVVFLKLKIDVIS
jgi:two-component system, LytTR family, sensor kinase